MKMKSILFLTIIAAMLCLQKIEAAHMPQKNPNQRYENNPTSQTPYTDFGDVSPEPEYEYTPNDVHPPKTSTNPSSSSSSKPKISLYTVTGAFTPSPSPKEKKEALTISIENYTGHKILVQLKSKKEKLEASLYKAGSTFSVDKESNKELPLNIIVRHIGLWPQGQAIKDQSPIIANGQLPPKSCIVKIGYDTEGVLAINATKRSKD